jgi:predicted glycoside hydrolase/deacetylase ChbG (UPF0249 family)
MSDSGRRLIVRADDAGSAVGANRAIREALRTGVVTAVGFMAVAPAFADAVATLRDELDQADVGVHATLTAEWDGIRWGPLSPRAQVPSLVAADGNFPPHPRELQEVCRPNEAVLEIRRQIHAIRDAGLKPVYLDTHMGIDRLPSMTPALTQLAREEGLLFVARDPEWVPYSAGGSEWLPALRTLSPGRYQLITHPGSDTPDMRAFIHAGLHPGQVARERGAETRLLCSSEFRRELQRADVQLVRFSS